MKVPFNALFPACICLGLIFCQSDAFAKRPKLPQLPDITHDGLVRVEDSNAADAVYLLPGADLSGYDKIILLEPQISFRKNWKRDINRSQRVNRINDRDIEKMIARGKDLLLEEFTEELEKKGYPVVHASESNVLLVRAAIINLDVYAPDPDNKLGIWVKVYTDGAGEATLILELSDSVTGQTLVRAVDTKFTDNDFSWRIPRSQSTNKMDARRAFSSWAQMLAKGLDRAKEAKTAEEE